MLRQVKQRSRNDCTVASIATILGIPYTRVHKAAVATGRYRLGSKYGADIGSVLIELGYEFRIRVYAGYKWRPRPRRALPFQQPFIASVNSRNLPGHFHAVVVKHGKVWDPTRRKLKVNFAYFMKYRRHMYYDVRKRQPDRA